MTGVKLPAGLAAAGGVLGSSVVHGTLPFTGLALGLYVAVAVGLAVVGLALRVAGRSRPER